MKILLLGKNGQLGWELQRALAPLGPCVCLGRAGEGEFCGDLDQLELLARTVRRLCPDVIVNAAAYTAVDHAENDSSRVFRTNAEAPTVLAELAAEIGAWLVHYSTDYVFDGSGHRPWQETDTTGPLNVYGESKLAGEQGIIGSGCQHLIFRTSWVYASRGGNFARTMLRLASERERLTVIHDQVGAPTGAALIADITAHALRAVRRDKTLAGLYHLAPAGEVSWNGYARHVLSFAHQLGIPLKAGAEAVDPIASADFPVAARRPLNSRLDTHKLQSAFDLYLPPWEQGVEQMLTEVLSV